MFKKYFDSAYPVLMVETQEPDRAERIIQEARNGWSFFGWDCMRGIRELPSGRVVDGDSNPVSMMAFLGKIPNMVMIAHNLHLFFDSPEIIQTLQNSTSMWKSQGCSLVIVGPKVQLRAELEKLIYVLDLPLPTPDELFAMQTELLAGLHTNGENGEGIEPDRHTALMARGLTEFEAETAFALSLVETGKLSPQVITKAKAQMIKKSGLMEFWPPVDPSQVGGLGQLKAYIANRIRAFEPGHEHLPRPKGLLLVGVPGTGKSLACKAAASILNWPLIRLDVSALKGSLVGESERNMRQATRTIEAFGECVVWLDEVEKAFAGVQGSGQTDSGTTAAMFGHFLVWLQETKAPMMVMATANDISQLPPEFLRAGRFDAVFFVDLPGRDERREIVKIQNAKYGAEIPELAAAAELDGFTGAEIEQIAKDSLFDGYETAFENVVPISRASKEKITALREWAKSRARIANTNQEAPAILRKIATAK